MVIYNSEFLKKTKTNKKTKQKKTPVYLEIQQKICLTLNL